MQIRSVIKENSERRVTAAGLTICITVLLAVTAAAQQSAIARASINAPAAGVGEATMQHPAFVVKSIGQGRPIIMIPGMSSSGATWDGTAAHLGANYRCIELTLAGFAGVPPIQAPLMSTARDQIADYIRENHLDRPVIMGHSLGGSLALDLAARYPQLVGPVIIVDSLPFFAGAWFQADTLDAAQPTIAKMRTGMEALTHEQWVDYAQSGASTNGMASHPDDQHTLIDWSLKSDQKTVTDAMIAMVSSDLRPELVKIDAPVLVIGTWVGLQSYGVTQASATALFDQQYAGVKHLQFVMAKQSRHFVMWDDPAWFYSQVDGFLLSSNHGGTSTAAMAVEIERGQ